MVFFGKTENQKKASTLGLVFLIMVALYFALSAVASSKIGNNISMLAMLVLSETIVVIPAIVYAISGKLSFKDDFGFKKIKIGTVFMTVLVSFLVLPLTAFVNVLTQFIVPNTMTQAQDSLLEAMPAGVLLLYVGVVAPICEEIGFRGMFANGFKTVAGVVKAILISGFIFGLFHMNLNQMGYAIVLGIAFAIVNTASGSIWTSIIMHIIINTFNQGLVIVLAKALQAVGNEQSIAEMTETVRQSKLVLLVYLGVYGILAIVAIMLLYLCIFFIAKHEGNEEAFQSIFKKKEIENGVADTVTEDKEGEVKVLFNLPMLLGVLACLVIIIYNIVITL